MKTLLGPILALLAIALHSCNSNNYDITEDIPDAIQVDTVEQSNLLTYSIPNADIYFDSGYVHVYTPVSGLTNYVIASSTVSVICEESIRSTFEGDRDYFNIFFYDNFGEPVVYSAGMNAVIDGKLRTISLHLNPACPNQGVQVDYTILGDRMVGTVTGEFFYLGQFTEPINACENWISTGIVEAQFNLPMVPCN